ncbi:MAG TPA: GAF domain-containing protein, partial [Polyangia bacterium]
MKRNEDQLAERVRSVPAWVVAAESLVLAAAVPVVGRWLNQADPFFVLGPVSWALLAPMLAGLRHGFMAGFGTAAALSFALVGAWRTGVLPVPATPLQLVVALLLTGMLSGQFAHLWATQARRIGGIYTFQKQRFDEFARSYQLLKVSHDALEERSAAARGNLRTALATLRAELLRAPGSDSALVSRAPLVLEVFQAFGNVQAAALLPVSANNHVEKPCALLGKVDDRVAHDPLVALAVKARRVVSVSHLGREGAADFQTSLAVAIPLVDVDGRVWAVLAVQELPFFALTQENLALFALMAGALADTLEFGANVKSYDAKSTARFEQRVRRCVVDARRNGVPGSLAVFSVSNAARAS